VAPATDALGQAVAAPLRATQSTPHSATGTNAVSRQVFPEVTRLVSRGDGTHRVTLQLRPEGLGEVRVTLTMREGRVAVTMSASAAAGRSLSADLPELHRMLGGTGVTETSVTVRDATLTQALPALDSGSRGTTYGGDNAGQTGQGAAQSWNHESNRQARTPDGHPAMDGTTHGTTSRSDEPTHRSRAGGLDVTV
jgi:flagellar hook-length control protein FliK